jgi:hypothetical protein
MMLMTGLSSKKKYYANFAHYVSNAIDKKNYHRLLCSVKIFANIFEKPEFICQGNSLAWKEVALSSFVFRILDQQSNTDETVKELETLTNGSTLAYRKTFALW